MYIVHRSFSFNHFNHQKITKHDARGVYCMYNLSVAKSYSNNLMNIQTCGFHKETIFSSETCACMMSIIRNS